MAQGATEKLIGLRIPTMKCFNAKPSPYAELPSILAYVHYGSALAIDGYRRWEATSRSRAICVPLIDPDSLSGPSICQQHERGAFHAQLLQAQRMGPLSSGGCHGQLVRGKTTNFVLDASCRSTARDPGGEIAKYFNRQTWKDRPPPEHRWDWLAKLSSAKCG